MKKILLTALLAAGVVTSANAVTYAYDVASNYSGSATTGGAYALSSKANFAIGNTSISSNYKRSGKFYLNAGHGGFDSNDRPTPMPLIGEYFYESEGNLDRTKHLQQWIIQNGGQVRMQRTTNTSADDWDLTAIATGSNNYGGYFISLHSNGANASANYHVALYKGSNSSNSVGGSERMAYWNSYNSYKNGCLSNATYSSPRSMADYDLMGWHYGVLRTNTCPGYLVETWFHDYRPESLRMKSSLYNKFLAWQIAVGNLTAPGGSGSLPGCIVGDVRDVTKGCGYTNYTTRGRDSKLALNNVTVTLTGNGQNQTVNTGSKCNGVYAFFVPAGTYTITVKKDGYKTQTHTLTVTNSTATQKNIDLVEGVDSGIALNPATAEFGETTVGNTSTKTITVTGTSLTSNITISNSNNTHFAISKTSLGTTGGTFVVTYKPQSAGSHSTTISFASGTHKASMVIDGSAKNPPLTFTEGWNYSEKNGKKAGWMANYTNYRNMAFGNGKLYVVDATNQVIKIINAQTGAHIKDMNMTGVSGGALALVDVAYVDGKILGTNIAISSDDTMKTLKVYQWDNDDAAPKVILSTTNIGGMNRIGDAIEIQGNLTSGKICYLAQQTRDYTDAEGNAKNGNCNSIVTYAITNGTVSTTPVVADIDAFIIGMSPRAIPDGNNFWIAGQSYLPSQVTANGQLTASVPLTAFNIEAAFHGCGNDFVPFTFKGNKYAFATDYQPVTKAGSTATADEIKTTTLLGGRAILIDGSAGWAVEGLKNSGSYPSAGMSSNTRNTTYSSSICVNVNGDNGVEMWVLIHNQGIAYYKHGTPATYNPGETPSTPSEPETPVTPSEPTYEFDDKNIVLKEGWNFSAQANSVPSYIVNDISGNTKFIRSIAYQDGKLYVLQNKAFGTPEVSIIDAYTGKEKGKLDMTGVSGGWCSLSEIIAVDGKILGSNIARSTTDGQPSQDTFKVYQWASDTAAPTVLLEDAAHTATIGASISVSGNLTNGRLWFTNQGTSKAVYYTISNGVVNTTMNAINLTTNGTTAFAGGDGMGSAEVILNSDGSLWVDAKDAIPTLFTVSGSTATKSKTMASVVSNYGTALKFFTFGTRKLAAATTYKTSNTYGQLALLDVAEGVGNETVIETRPADGLGSRANDHRVTGVCVSTSRNDGMSLDIWVVVYGQGVAYYYYDGKKDSATGVEEIATDVEAPVEYYNLQGVKVANPEKGLYIKKQGKKATKVIL